MRIHSQLMQLFVEKNHQMPQKTMLKIYKRIRMQNICKNLTYLNSMPQRMLWIQRFLIQKLPKLQSLKIIKTNQCIRSSFYKQYYQLSINIVLIVSFFIVIGIVLLFLIKKQRMFQQNEYLTNLNSKYKIDWKMSPEIQANCNYCNLNGAVLQTPCNHFFHVDCFSSKAIQKVFPQCPKCNYQIRKKIKVSCQNCKTNSFKIRLTKIQQLSQIIQDAQTLHSESCASSMQPTTNDQLISS